MARSGQLGTAGPPAESSDTTAVVMLEKTDDGFTIAAVNLDVTARVPSTDQRALEKAANSAKAGCPVSRLLSAEIAMGSKLKA